MIPILPPCSLIISFVISRTLLISMFITFSISIISDRVSMGGTLQVLDYAATCIRYYLSINLEDSGHQNRILSRTAKDLER